ncbi:MAG TPA: neutral zinc metallopeptidase [Actinospica sp.]|nr:neutral zinc metallopeptidase [Actinospica sp.]
MRFNEDARLDTSQVDDARGRSFPGGRAGMAGGGLGIIGLIVALLFGVDPSLFSGSTAAPSRASGGTISSTSTQLAGQCRSGADANRQADCRVVAVVNSVQNYWSAQFAASGRRYSSAATQIFSGQTSTGCGSATSQVGPFYCPADHTVYLDLGFWDELSNRFGAPGVFAEAYVVAHEYGHHVQNLLGAMRLVGKDTQGADSKAVRLELQADCYAGVWARHAAGTKDSSGQALISELTTQDISQGLAAAAAVGDDRIQQSAARRVTPETWTHGSSAQRQRWFTTGYQSGDAGRCDTFGAAAL